MIEGYPDRDLISGRVRRGLHRDVVGGMWDEIGELQFSFVTTHGLAPDMYLLDVGCGCLRGGVHLVRYLQPGHYFGMDSSQDLMTAGYERELPPELQEKLPRENLFCTDDFDATGFGVTFEVALAHSLFTHLSLNQIRLCLARTAEVVRVGGVFHATIFDCPEGHDWKLPLRQEPGGITTFPHRNPVHYRREDIEFCIRSLPWRMTGYREWNHPRNQFMLTFTRAE